MCLGPFCIGIYVFLSYFAGKIFRRESKETAERNAEKGIYGGDLQTVGPLKLRRWWS